MADIHKKLPYTYDEVKSAIRKTTNLSEFETARREQEDERLKEQIEAEQTRAENAETDLNDKISEKGSDITNLTTELANEKTDRQASDSELQTNITTEAEARINADSNLQNNIASVDKKVDDLATEIDARSDVVDVVGTKADLLNYQEKLTKNDIVKVLTDETQNDKTSYYRYPQAAKTGEVDPSKWKLVGAVTQYALTSELTSEAETRENADNSLSQAISDEANRATNAESNLSNSLSGATEKITNHIADANNPHSVTKAQVGLGDVENTGDSATPEENGDKKFTTGGAYSLKTALESQVNSKQDTISDLSTIRSNAEAGKAAKDQIGNYTVKSNVPENAVFTDTTYSAGDNVTITNNIISAKDTTYSDVTDSSSGLMTSVQKKKLDTIAEGAEVNVQSDWSVSDTTSDAYIKNKPALSISNGTITIGNDKITPITSLDGYAKTSDLTSYSKTDHTHTAKLESSSETGTSLSAGSTYKLTTGGNSVIFKMPEASGIEAATDNILGGIKTGYTENNQNYAVKIDSEKAYVTVPWINTTYTAGDNITITNGKISAKDTTYSEATTSVSGLMSANDKTKLNGIAAGANNYTLPKATATSLGGVQTGYSQSGQNYKLDVDDSGNGFVNVPWVNTTYNAASKDTDGLMSKSDYSKLQGIAENANNYSLPTANSTTLGGVKSSATGTTSGKDYSVEVNSDGTMKVNVPWENTTYSTATTSSAGLMSSTDKTNLNKLTVTKGSSTTPIYLNAGVPTALSYSLNKTVPSDAVFTDTLQQWSIYSTSSQVSASGDSWTLIGTVSGEKYGGFVSCHGWEASQMGYIKIMKTSSSSYLDNETSTYCANMATGENGYWSAQMLSVSAIVPPGVTYYIYAKKMSWVTYSSYYIILKN